jgi:hypothetical protein
VKGVPRSPGAFYTLTKRQLKVAGALARAAHARMIMGVQFEANVPAEAAAESRAMLSAIGRKRIAGFELGNEPELYPFAQFYKSGGVSHTGRQLPWDMQTLIQDYNRVAGAMGSVPLAGPAIGNPRWMAQLGSFLGAVRGVSVVTLHYYPLQGCSVGPGAPNYPTIPNLLADPVATGAADPFAPFVATVHAHGVKVRYDEMNTVACGNGRGVANTFASALWSVAALFEAASIGADGVNIHTYPGSADQLFKITHDGSGWRASLTPEYYGLLLFSHAAPAGSHMLQVAQAGNTSMLRTWGTRARSGRTRVVLINDDPAHAKTVAVRVNGAGSKATLERLTAPSVRSTKGVKLGGWSVGRQTRTGRARGPFHTTKLSPAGGAFMVRLGAGSAALLSVR